MNFEGLDPSSLAEYASPLHPALEPVLDPHLPATLLQNVELDPDGVALDGMAVPESVHIMEGVYSELHTAVSEVGVPVSVAHFDLHEEMLWVGNHGVGARAQWVCGQGWYRGKSSLRGWDPGHGADTAGMGSEGTGFRRDWSRAGAFAPGWVNGGLALL